MTVRALTLFLPLAALLGLLAMVLLAYAAPLSPLGAPIEHRTDDKSRLFLYLFATLPFWYLVAFGLLSVLGARPGVRVGVSLAAGIVALVVAFAELFSAGFRWAELELGAPGAPFVAFDAAALWVTTPIRERHYVVYLEDSDRRQRGRAAVEVESMVHDRWLSSGRPVPARVQRALGLGMRSLDPEVRLRSGRALAVSGPWTDEAVALIAEALRDHEPEVRAEAARQLGEARHQDERLAAPLIALIEHDADGAVREAAVAALRRVAPGAPAPSRIPTR